MLILTKELRFDETQTMKKEERIWEL